MQAVRSAAPNSELLCRLLASSRHEIIVEAVRSFRISSEFAGTTLSERIHHIIEQDPDLMVKFYHGSKSPRSAAYDASAYIVLSLGYIGSCYHGGHPIPLLAPAAIVLSWLTFVDAKYKLLWAASTVMTLAMESKELGAIALGATVAIHFVDCSNFVDYMIKKHRHDIDYLQHSMRM